MGTHTAILGGSEWMGYSVIMWLLFLENLKMSEKRSGIASLFEPRAKKRATEGQPIVLDDDAATIIV